MTIQCSGCRRIYIRGEWSREDAEADCFGWCPPCLQVRMDKMSRDYERAGARLLRQRAKGYGAVSGDAFKGFRGTE